MIEKKNACLSILLLISTLSVSPWEHLYATRLYVPENSIDLYKTAYPWKYFHEIIGITIPGDVTGNGTVGDEDIDFVLNCIMNNIFDTKADINHDNKVNVEDLVDIVSIIKNELDGNIVFSLYAKNSYTHQSAAAYNDYLFLVPKSRGKIYMYSLKEKKLLCTCKMTAMTEQTESGGDIYHCNQTCFGSDYYDVNDPFPLLYISQRARSDKRCFTEVFRVIAKRSDQDSDFSSFKLEHIQTIYFPPMSESNSLGNVNTVIDRERKLLYTYSRNNTKEDANYHQCKITCFPIPDVYQKDVYLEDADIKQSFMLDISAYCMQGACIEKDYLYIARGLYSVNYIDINIIDLKKGKNVKQLDLLSNGYTWEPEGCFFYNGHLMIATGKKIWELNFDKNTTDIKTPTM